MATDLLPKKELVGAQHALNSVFGQEMHFLISYIVYYIKQLFLAKIVSFGHTKVLPRGRGGGTPCRLRLFDAVRGR